MKYSKIGIGIFFLLVNLVYGIKVEKLSEVVLDQKKEIIQRGWLISVNDSEYLYLIDQKASNLKLYDKMGHFVDTVKKKGYGPQEIARPLAIDYRKGILAVGDAGKNQLNLYKVNETGLNEFKDIKGSNLGFDIRLIGNVLFIAGFKADLQGTIYGLYCLDLDTEKTDYLVTLDCCYGFSSKKELMAKIMEETNIIGRLCYLDADERDAFICWQGDLNVLAVNLETKKIASFGNKTKNYIKPKVTQKMIELYKTRSSQLDIEYHQYSYLTGLFVDKAFIAVLYANYREEIPGWQTFIQFYTRNGQFIKEEELPGAINNDDYPMKSFFYSPDTDNLYFLKKTIDKELNDVYSLIKYRIGQ